MPDIFHILEGPEEYDPLDSWWFRLLFVCGLVFHMVTSAAECGDVRADTLTLTTTPAQRARGISWAERFESEALVERNGGTLTGSPTVSFGITLNGTTQYVSYDDGRKFTFGDGADDQPFSVTGWVYMTDATEFALVAKGVYNTDAEYRILVDASDKLNWQLFDESVADCYIGKKYDTVLSQDQWVHVGCTYDGSETVGGLKIYIDGVAVAMVDASNEGGSYVAMENLASNVHVGRNDTLYAEGQIRNLKVWSVELEAQEVLNLSGHTTYHYINDSTLLLPMGIEQHDPAGVRTLDVSGSGAHAIFGDGSTPATYPTKLTDHHGYDYDGGDYLVVPATGLLNSVGITIAMEFYPDFDYDENAFIFLHNSSPGGTEYAVYKGNNPGNTLIVYLGGTSIQNIPSATYSPYWRKGRRNVLVIAGDSANNLSNAYLNEGHVMVDAATAWSPADPTDLMLGSSAPPGSYYDGEITYYEVFPFVLTATQREDLGIRLQTRASKQ